VCSLPHSVESTCGPNPVKTKNNISLSTQNGKEAFRSYHEGQVSKEQSDEWQDSEMQLHELRCPREDG